MTIIKLLTITLALIMLVGCSQAEQPTRASTPLDVAQSPTDVVEQPAISPSDTPLPVPIETSTPTEANSVEAVATFTPNEIPITESIQISCDGILTSPNQEGPYYTAGSPERASLIEQGMPGTSVLILGKVFDQDCNPVPGAKVDFWLADVNGEYDNVGYMLRGHVFTDDSGYYEIESIEPGIYTGRPPHIHVKVFAPEGQELLTTQMYFPGSEGSGDVLAAPDLLVKYIEPDETGRKRVIFNFVVSY